MDNLNASFEVDDHKKTPKRKRRIGCIIAFVIVLIAALVIMAPVLFLYFSSINYDYQMEKYGGHGFDYMGGYSSTDFTGYHVYDGEKLVEMDHPAEFMIENIEDMPVLDGAEACYPVYTAVAKALYKDIDKIEEEVLVNADELDYQQSDWYYNNGRVVTFTNTVYGYERLIQGEVDLIFAARPSSKMKDFAHWYNEQIVSIPIGREAFVFFVEKDNPVDNLTADQARKIYSGEIKNWKEVGGKNQEIIAFQRPEESGSQVMMKYFMGDVPLMEPDTFSVVDAMGGVLENVKEYRNEKGAIGYTFQYFLAGLQQEKDVKMLSIDGVYPSVDNIKNCTYPVTVSLVVAKLASNDDENVQKVVDFLLSKDGQEIIERTGYGPLSIDESGKAISEPIVENELPESATYVLDSDEGEMSLLMTGGKIEPLYDEIIGEEVQGIQAGIMELHHKGKIRKFDYYWEGEERFSVHYLGRNNEEFPLFYFSFKKNDSDNTITITEVDFDYDLIKESEVWAKGEITEADFIKVGDRFKVQ